MSDPGETAKTSHFQVMRGWCIQNPRWTITVITLAALAPFLAKPFNLDDPLFVWAAQHIQSHPADPYGFDVNWFGSPQRMWAAMLNPPLMSYYLAMAAKLLSSSEVGLHFACLAPALGVVLGVYRLASRFCKWPIFAALATLFTPAFMVSSTTVMCDVSMLAFWIWAVVFWTEGIKREDFWKLSIAGTLIGLATLTKFNGVCLIPLLAAYAWMEKRVIGRWALFLLIPVVVLSAHEWATIHVYGQPHFLMANQLARTNQTVAGTRSMVEVFTALTYIGGCFAIALFCTPYLWRGKVILAFTCGGALFLGLALARGMMAKNYYWLSGNKLMFVEIQILLWAATGVSVLALCVVEVWRTRNSESWLLLFWVFGIFVYAAFVYFMMNARAILPMGPAVAILIARRLDRKFAVYPAGIKWSLIASAALSMLAAQADFQQAETARQSAVQICSQYSATPTRVWFDGHWGFQYYMQRAGAWPVNLSYPELGPGDILVVPKQNSNQLPINPRTTILESEFSFHDFPWFATFNLNVGAGFYSSFWGPLPFSFGSVPPQRVLVYTVKPPAEAFR